MQSYRHWTNLDTFLPFILGLTPKTKSYIATSWIYFSALHSQIPKAYSAEAHGSHHLNTDRWQSGGPSHLELTVALGLGGRPDL